VTLTNDLVNSNENIPEIKIHNFSVGMPVPYMLFTKGLKETMKMNVTQTRWTFYMYAGYQYHQIPNVDTNGSGCLTSCHKSYFQTDKICCQL
jgi:hypothetical protein